MDQKFNAGIVRGQRREKIAGVLRIGGVRQAQVVRSGPFSQDGHASMARFAAHPAARRPTPRR